MIRTYSLCLILFRIIPLCSSNQWWRCVKYCICCLFSCVLPDISDPGNQIAHKSTIITKLSFTIEAVRVVWFKMHYYSTLNNGSYKMQTRYIVRHSLLIQMGESMKDIRVLSCWQHNSLYWINITTTIIPEQYSLHGFRASTTNIRENMEFRTYKWANCIKIIQYTCVLLTSGRYRQLNVHRRSGDILTIWESSVYTVGTLWQFS